MCIPKTPLVLEPRHASLATQSHPPGFRDQDTPVQKGLGASISAFLVEAKSIGPEERPYLAGSGSGWELELASDGSEAVREALLPED